MNESGLTARHVYKSMLIFFLTLLVIFSGCSSSHHASKGKPGQVPCPCENKSSRR